MSELNSSKTKKYILTVIKYIFIIGYILLLIFSLLELIKPRIIMGSINLPIFLGIIVVCGIINIFFSSLNPGKNKVLKFNDYIAITILSILFGIFIAYWTRTIGWLSILVGLAGAIICLFFIISILKNNVIA